MKKIHLTILWLAVVAAFTACKNEVDDVFDKSASQRISEAMAQCRETLVGAKGGWLMEYYPDTQYGGYNVLLKFDDNSLVTVQNEAYKPETTCATHFKIEQSQGLILSFDEYNPLFHYFSDPHNPDNIGEDGKGMKGDFEFRVISFSPEKITLVGKKHGSRIVMTPLKDGETWDGYLGKLAETIELMDYSRYSLQVGDNKYTVTMSYRQMSFTDTKTALTMEMPFMYTPEGIKLYSPVIFEGKTISGFTYSEDDNWLNPADNSVVLHPVKPPLSELFVNNMWFVTYSRLGEFAKPYWDQLKASASQLPAGAEVIQYGIFGLAKISQSQPAPQFGLSIISSGYGAVYLFEYERLGDARISLRYTGKTSLDGNYYNQHGNYSNAGVPFGTMQHARTFTLSTDNLKSPSYVTLTDENEPTNVITLLRNPVANPFDN